MENTISRLMDEYSDDFERLRQDTKNGFAFAELSYMYDRLQNLGPWHPSEITMEFIIELDMMHAAFSVTYGRIFSDGPRKINRSKVPAHLREYHDQLIELRNQRYAHNDNHSSVAIETQFELDNDHVVVGANINLAQVLGAPPEWKELIDWLGEHLVDQQRAQLKRLSEKTGVEFVPKSGPPPDWVTKNTT